MWMKSQQFQDILDRDRISQLSNRQPSRKRIFDLGLLTSRWSSAHSSSPASGASQRTGPIRCSCEPQTLQVSSPLVPSSQRGTSVSLTTEGPPEEAVPAELGPSQSKTGTLVEVGPEKEEKKEEGTKGTEEEELLVDEEEESWLLRKEGG